MRGDLLYRSSFLPSPLSALASIWFDTLTVTKLSHQYLRFGHHIGLAILCHPRNPTLRSVGSLKTGYLIRR